MRKTRAKQLRALAMVHKFNAEKNGRQSAEVTTIYRRFKKAYNAGSIVFNPNTGRFTA